MSLWLHVERVLAFPFGQMAHVVGPVRHLHFHISLAQRNKGLEKRQNYIAAQCAATVVASPVAPQQQPDAGHC
ncbi:MAG: hypothetical protein WCB44_17160, partial [Stellaceae bacterium]